MKLSAIPGYAEAIAREAFLRDASFVPVNESICGIEVAPLTVAHLGILQSIGSPFVCGGMPEPQDAIRLLCIVAVDAGKPKSFKRWRFIRRCGRLNLQRCFADIFDYIKGAFEDAPNSGGNRKASASYYSLCASIVGLIAREYGWSESAILSLPLKRLWQYRAEIIASRGDKSFLSNPSDIRIQEWLDRQSHVN